VGLNGFESSFGLSFKDFEIAASDNLHTAPSQLHWGLTGPIFFQIFNGQKI
jgi:hypothetical protein